MMFITSLVFILSTLRRLSIIAIGVFKTLPITAKLVANMLEVAGVDRLLTIDLHAAQIQGFFDIPVDHLMGAPLIADYFERRGMVGSDYVVVSPDHRWGDSCLVNWQSF